MGIKNWKLKLRLGKIKSSFNHYSVIAHCEVGQLTQNYLCEQGKAHVALKIWAISTDQAAEIAQDLGSEIGYVINGNINIYQTEPSEPPIDKPYAYDISFHSYK